MIFFMYIHICIVLKCIRIHHTVKLGGGIFEKASWLISLGPHFKEGPY